VDHVTHGLIIMASGRTLAADTVVLYYRRNC
jgi:hypothetical protein